MSRSATIRPEQIRKARKILQDLPIKNECKTRSDAAKILENDFKKALKKGYSPKELSIALKAEGIIIPIYLINEFRNIADENTNHNYKKKIQEE